MTNNLASVTHFITKRGGKVALCYYAEWGRLSMVDIIKIGRFVKINKNSA
jgi:hypothetical protein